MSLNSGNAAQKQAIAHGDGPLLVLAGAGTGKTWTLTQRVKRLLDSGVPGREILLLTFTRKAANEMLERVEKLSASSSENNQVMSGTFHSMAYRDLRKSRTMNSLFGLIDDSEASAIIRQLIKKYLPGLKQAGFSARDALKCASLSANKCLRVTEVIFSHLPDFTANAAEIEELLQRYNEHKQEQHLVDYDGILQLWLKVLEAGHPALPTLKCRYIMIDEYQDTTELQTRLLKALCLRHRNIMAVGDDCQSIYSFRGAEAARIRNFPLDFTGAQTICLEENYRSTDEILGVSNKVILASQELIPRELRSAVKASGREPLLLQEAGERAMVNKCLARIQEHCKQGIPLQQQAVLYRSGMTALGLERELLQRQIPYVKYGGRKLTESVHFRDFLSLLICLNAPEIAAAAAGRVFKLMAGVGAMKCQELLTVLMRDAKNLPDEKVFPDKAKTAYNELFELRSRFAGQELSKDLFRTAINWLKPFLFHQHEDALKRLREIETFCSSSEDFDTLEDLYTNLVLDEPNKDKNAAEDCLVLSTIHSAKGKEWDCVYLLSANQGSLPSANGDMEEERRLFYVAVTRARLHLDILIDSTRPESSFLHDAGMILEARDEFAIGYDPFRKDRPRRDSRYHSNGEPVTPEGFGINDIPQGHLGRFSSSSQILPASDADANLQKLNPASGAGSQQGADQFNPASDTSFPRCNPASGAGSLHDAVTPLAPIINAPAADWSPFGATAPSEEKLEQAQKLIVGIEQHEEELEEEFEEEAHLMEFTVVEDPFDMPLDQLPDTPQQINRSNNASFTTYIADDDEIIYVDDDNW